MKVCILVHNNVAADARVIKQADALTEAGHKVTVIGVRNPNDPGKTEWLSGKPWKLIWYNRDKKGLVGRFNWLKTALRAHAAEFAVRYAGLTAGVAENALIRAYPELVRLAIEQRADVYHANDLNTLPVACQAAASTGGRVIYDAHEFYTDEHEKMSEEDRKVVRFVEEAYIRRVNSVVTVSPGIAKALADLYQISEPVPIYNVPPLAWMSEKVDRDHSRLSVLHQGRIGFGYRGLEDLIAALPQLSDAVEIHFRGFMSKDVKTEIQIAAKRYGVSVFIHSPLNPKEAVQSAAQHDVGLVLTQPVSRHTQLTIPNKIFEYFLAGLAVVSTKLPGPEYIMNQVDAGFTYRPGDSGALAHAINRLAEDRELLTRFKQNALRAALERYNWDLEKQKLLAVYGGIERCAAT